MLNLEQVLKQDQLVRAMTGLNRKAFDPLLPTFTAIYEQTRPEATETACGGRRTLCPMTTSPTEALLYPVLLQVLSNL